MKNMNIFDSRLKMLKNVKSDGILLILGQNSYEFMQILGFFFERMLPYYHQVHRKSFFLGSGVPQVL